MTDVWDIAQYVEAHPDNYQQRWRLAKKLYMAWEYRLALEHLLILKNEWEPRINVMRYLAATYYRLSRYEEAVRELRTAIQLWPQELGLYEQLARTLAVADKKYEALDVWTEIAEMDPDHPFAQRAVEHLRKEIAGEEGGAGGNGKHPAGAGGEAEPLGANEVLCPNCGQKNSMEFRRCWKCHAALYEGASEEEGAVQPKVEPRGVPWPLLSGLLIAALFGLGAYLTMRGFAAVDEAGLNARAPQSADEFFARSFLWTRVIVGVVLLIGWPVAWRLGAILLDVDDQIYNETMYQAGAVLALATFALLWLPWPWVWLAAAVPALVAVLIVAGIMKLRPKAAAGVWFVQMGLAALLALVAVVGRHGPGLLTDAPAIVAFAERDDVTSSAMSNFSAPRQAGVRWEGSGAGWLDRHANTANIRIQLGPHSRRVFFAIVEDGEERLFQPVRDESYTHTLSDIDPGKDYTLTVRSEDEEVDVSLRVDGVLPVTLTVREEPPSPPSPVP